MNLKQRLNALIASCRSHLPLVVVGAAVILMLFFNEETSLSLNMKYEHEIERLKANIEANDDSASYYNRKRMRLLSDTEDLEAVAREQYNMQRPTEDVYIIKEK